MIQDADSLAAGVRRAVQHVLSGTKGDADTAGRLLMAIAADTSDGVLSEVEEVLTAADPRFWIALEYARDRLCWEKPGESFHRPSETDSVPAMSVKALFADGRARERAVRLLTGSGSPAVLPVLGLRAADWVPQVRETARNAIGSRLAEDGDGAVLTALAPMALLLAGRRQGRWLAEEVTRRLAEPSCRHVVTGLLDNPDFRLRRTAYLVLTDAGGLEIERAVHAAVSDGDIVVRSRCAEVAKRLATDSESVPLIRRMLTSRTPIVRAEALLALNRLGELDPIQAALPDRSSLVRGTARFCLKAHHVDFAEIYRSLLSGNIDAVTPGAVAGLAETGTAAETELITPLFDHPRVKVRAEAIRAVCALAPAIDTERMLGLITENASPAITRQAVSALATRGVAIDPERLLALIEPARPVTVRLAARELLAFRNVIWRLTVDVMLLADSDSAVAKRAVTDLKGAMREQIYARPSGKAAELLSTHLVDADRLLAPLTAQHLRLIVGMARPA